ncbi:beta/gamma crystallin domain-containing protein [Streptomyces fumanus]|uniref:Streptomyces killer toxin-like beta/gamma crystallin domain-containing protein n=1 Tax=Streptomyces fumanus TaxID=67302 RepID=A0A919AGL9_9ACTN|nr:beta/gamma crystallin domain-containing protein [Streptomyces fumanus]GHF06319.1 hypothetical protein GCM10018772_34060 [Streptomyces fumanus]
MKRIARRAVLAGLSSAALLTSLSLGATNAAAINEVPCGSEFLKLQLHYSGGGWFDRCYANAGQVTLDTSGSLWVTKIETGNNMMQWYGDGRWQPAVPIAKWTTYTWPSFPDGVKIERINITANVH